MSTITPQISGSFIIRVAELYTDFNRAIMEYVDNSIDSAEQYFDSDTNTYTEEIIIKVDIDPSTKQITIEDNCTGIKDLDDLVREIGNSDKKADFTTNGQFGFGVYAFMAGCEQLEFKTRHASNERGHSLILPKKEFEKDKLNDVQISQKIQIDKAEKGTTVTLARFENEVWESIDYANIKQQIADHFEILLARKGLKLLCDLAEIKPYDYGKISGEPYREEITEVDYIPRKNQPSKKVIFTHPIRIFLKMSEEKQVNRPPSFIVKGRRVNLVKSIEGFKSHYGSKNMLWGHQQITGYIDLEDNFEPVIQRNNFKDIKKEKFKAFNQKMKELEQLIYECFILEKNKEKQNKSFAEASKKISDIVTKLAREDALNLKRQSFSKKGEGTGHPLEEGYGSKDWGTDRKNKTKKPRFFGLNEGDGVGVNPVKEGRDVFEDDSPNKRSGFNIVLTDKDLIKTEEGRSMGSIITEQKDGSKTIEIFRKHPFFKTRMKESKQGDISFTPRSVGYIAHEIAIHYQDEIFGKNLKNTKEYKKDILLDATTIGHRLEEALSVLTT